MLPLRLAAALRRSWKIFRLEHSTRLFNQTVVHIIISSSLQKLPTLNLKTKQWRLSQPKSLNWRRDSLTCVQARDFTRQQDTIIKPINNWMERNGKSVTPSLQQQQQQAKTNALSVFVWRLPIFSRTAFFSQFEYIIVIRKYKAAECNRLFMLDTLRVRRKRRKKEFKTRAMVSARIATRREKRTRKKKSIA